MSRAVAVPRSSAVITQTFVWTRYGTTYWSGPSVSYGKNASSDRIAALPARNIGPAGAIRIQRLPKKMPQYGDRVCGHRDEIHIHVHESISWTL